MKICEVKTIKSAFIDGDDIWLLDDGYCALFKYNLIDDAVSFMDFFPKDVEYAGAFREIQKAGNEIFFFPDWADDVYVYNLVQKKYIKLNIPYDGLPEVRERKRRTTQAVRVGDFFYAVHHQPCTLIKIDIFSKKFKVYDLTLHVGKYAEIDEVPYIGYFSIDADEQVLKFPYGANTIVSFNLSSEEYRIVEIDGMTADILCEDPFIPEYVEGCKKIGDESWLFFSRDGQILCTRGGYLRSYIVPHFEESHKFFLEPCYWMIADIIHNDEKLYVFCVYDSSVYIVDLKTCSVEKIDNPYIDKSEERQYYNRAMFLDNKRIMFWGFTAEPVFILNLNTKEIQEKRLRFTKNTFADKKAFCKIAKRVVLYSDDLMGLIDIVNNKFQFDSIEKDKSVNRVDIGAMIYGSL